MTERNDWLMVVGAGATMVCLTGATLLAGAMLLASAMLLGGCDFSSMKHTQVQQPSEETASDNPGQDRAAHAPLEPHEAQEPHEQPALGEAKSGDDPHAHHAHHGQHESMPADAPLDGQSVFHLASAWHDQDGESFTLGSLRGKPTVVVMFFATCTEACPLLVNDVRNLESALPKGVADELQVVLVSFDSARDKPARLAEYADERGIDLGRWSLLHGEDKQIRELAAVLGVRYRETPEGDFIHSNVITVLDAEGRILHQTEGLGQPVAAAAKKLVAIQ